MIGNGRRPPVSWLPGAHLLCAGGLKGVHRVFVSRPASTAAELDSIVLRLSSHFLKNTHSCITIISFSQTAVQPLSTARVSAAEHCPYLQIPPKERSLLKDLLMLGPTILRPPRIEARDDSRSPAQLAFPAKLLIDGSQFGV